MPFTFRIRKREICRFVFDFMFSCFIDEYTSYVIFSTWPDHQQRYQICAFFSVLQSSENIQLLDDFGEILFSVARKRAASLVAAKLPAPLLLSLFI